MRIWNEKLIPLLCQKHLCAMWRKGLGCWYIITENKKGYRNHPATQEFMGSPSSLYDRLGKVRQEMLRLGYHPKEMPTNYLVFHKLPCDKVRVWQPLKKQVDILKAKGCKCKV